MNGLGCLMRSITYTFTILMGAAGFQARKAFVQANSVEVQASAQPIFDVVSIRPTSEEDNSPTHITNSAHNGYLRAVNVNLKALLEVAYDIPDIRMYGGPEWLTKERFSLEAKADPKLDEELARLPPEQGKQIKRKMLAALLADRYKLIVHTETREMPIYAMVILKGGPKLGGLRSGAGTIAAGTDRITVRSGSDSLAILTYELSWRLGRPVIDRTGLQYRQELIISWQDGDKTSLDSNGPSLVTAIQEQLGLKLLPTKGFVTVLLIDHAERPAEN